MIWSLSLLPPIRCLVGSKRPIHISLSLFQQYLHTTTATLRDCGTNNSMRFGKKRRIYVAPVLFTLFGILMSISFTIWWQMDTQTPQTDKLSPANALYHHQKPRSLFLFGQRYDPYKTLVIYVYHESDGVAKENLQFFLKVKSMKGEWIDWTRREARRTTYRHRHRHLHLP